MSGTTLTAFTPGDLVISVYGAANGTGTYTLDQASAITLEELTTAGALAGNLVLPQTTAVVNGTTEYAVSGEYGSASEGALQLSADGRSLVILGYGVNATAFNTAGTAGNSAYGNAALGQSTSITGGTYIPVARIVADIGANASIDTSTSLYNIYNVNNPRSVASVNGSTFYLSGQGVKGSTNQGVFLATDGASTATAIDTSTDTREAEIYNGQLYVSRDTTQGGTAGTSNIASYGAALPTSATAPTVLPGIAGRVTLASGQANTVNASAVGTSVNLSPEGFFFANATTLYIADGGFPKEGGIGDGGLQKWSLVNGTWVLDYTLSQGLNLVADTASAGTTGLFGLTGTVVGGTVQLYATTSTAGELDQSYLYGINDTLAATTLPAAESFTQLMAAAPDSIIRGVAFAPTAAAVAPAAVTVSSGQSSAGIVVSSGNTLLVQAGGTITGATVLSGGTATVSGSDSGAIVAHGGGVVVTGSASGDQVAGGESAGATGVISNAMVEDGGSVNLLVAGGTAAGTLVTTGGVLNISAAATATNTTISGGAVVLQTPTATLAGTVVFAGPGLLQDTAIAAAGAGDQAVISGFGTGDVIDLSAVTASGATLTKTVSGGNTTATVTSGGVSQSFVFAGAVTGSLGLGTDPNGAAEIVFVPAPTTNVTVSAGVTSSGLVVASGSTLTVNAGGTAVSATILSGGLETVAGSDSGTVISAGGSQLLLGSATGDQVYGLQTVSSTTALVTNETVFNGGIVNDVLKTAVLTGTTISSGGTLNISGNTTASNTVLTNGGLINLQSPKANVTGTLTFSGGGTLEETGVISAGFGDLAVIRGFTSGASVDVATIAPGTATLTSTTSGGNTVVTVSGGGTSQPFTFAGTNYNAGYFVLGADAANGTQITTNVPCYCRGTRVLTASGEVAVEDLAVGDLLATVSGAERPIKWIGRRSYGGRFTCGNRDVLPIRIRAGALADGVPQRDLFVSPLHAMFLDGLLIPAKSLVNGSSVVQVARMDQVDYFHVELDSHDVILAENAAAESFVDDDSRAMFHNAADYHGEPIPAIYCAERVEDGALLEPIWQRIAARSQAKAA